MCDSPETATEVSRYGIQTHGRPRLLLANISKSLMSQTSIASRGAPPPLRRMEMSGEQEHKAQLSLQANWSQVAVGRATSSCDGWEGQTCFAGTARNCLSSADDYNQSDVAWRRSRSCWFSWHSHNLRK